MKICELKIQSYADREKIISALVNAGYRVSLDVRKNGFYSYNSEYYIIVEEAENANAKQTVS